MEKKFFIHSTGLSSEITLIEWDGPGKYKNLGQYPWFWRVRVGSVDEIPPEEEWKYKLLAPYGTEISYEEAWKYKFHCLHRLVQLFCAKMIGFGELKKVP